jgi:hypothetical protein
MGYGVNGALDGWLSWLYYDFLDRGGLSNVLLLPTLCLFRGCFVSEFLRTRTTKINGAIGPESNQVLYQLIKSRCPRLSTNVTPEARLAMLKATIGSMASFAGEA